jgi:hypothetical protein
MKRFFPIVCVFLIAGIFLLWTGGPLVAAAQQNQPDQKGGAAAPTNPAPDKGIQNPSDPAPETADPGQDQPAPDPKKDKKREYETQC